MQKEKLNDKNCKIFFHQEKDNGGKIGIVGKHRKKLSGRRDVIFMVQYREQVKNNLKETSVRSLSVTLYNASAFPESPLLVHYFLSK